MDNHLLDLTANYGLPGIIIAVLFIQNFFLVRKIISVIENNSKALIELKEHCNRRVPA